MVMLVCPLRRHKLFLFFPFFFLRDVSTVMEAMIELFCACATWSPAWSLNLVLPAKRFGEEVCTANAIPSQNFCARGKD